MAVARRPNSGAADDGHEGAIPVLLHPAAEMTTALPVRVERTPAPPIDGIVVVPTVPTVPAVPAAQARTMRLDAQSAPARTASGGCLKVDHALALDGIALISGWVSDGLNLEIDGLRVHQIIPRNDIGQVIGRPATGFVALVEAGANGTKGAGATKICIRLADHGIDYEIPVMLTTREADVHTGLTSLLPHLPPLIAHLVPFRAWGRCLVRHCQPLPQEYRRQINGVVEEVRHFPGCGTAACGWAVSLRPADFWLAGSNGAWRALSDTSRHPHKEVDKTPFEDLGAYTAGTGFFGTLDEDTDAAGVLNLVVATAQGLYVVSQKEAAPGSVSPLAYARWAFSFPTPRSSFIGRMERHDGRLIEHLIAQYRSRLPQEHEVWDAGTLPAKPEISVIVPLYGRADYIEHQLLEFCSDPDFTSGKAELIYVIDDPRLVETMREWTVTLAALYDVPFRVVWGGINRGYAGANNLGRRVARGKALVFLNSDVFPLEPGWCCRMAHALAADKTVGAVGARLEYPDGSLQHLGISFVYEQDLSVWLNTHPRAGVDVPARTGKPLEVPAATGACIAVRAKDFDAIGGMDEGFLIGDFEDTDLCLRLRKRGGRIVVLPDTRLVHLERQSFSQLGAPDFRLSVARFNAWRHSRLWGEDIAELMQKEWA